MSNKTSKTYNRPLEHKEYLKLKYFSQNDDKKDNKKTIIKKKVVKNKKIRIFDDDIDLKKIEKNGSEDELYFGTKEEKPQIAGVVDERPLHMRRKDIDTNRWRTVSTVEDINELNGKGMDEKRKKRLRHDSDSDLSPVRPKDSNQLVIEISPKRRKGKRHDSDSDLSPQRDTNYMKKTHSRSDLNREDNGNRRRHDSDSDLSPEREIKGSKPWMTLPSNYSRQGSVKREDNRQRHDSDSDLSPPRPQSSGTQLKGRPEKTLSGKKSGLSDGKHLRQELIEVKKREQKLFQTKSAEDLGKNAKTVFRDSKSGRIRDLEEEARLQYEKDLINDKIDSEKKAKYEKWSKGLVQTQEQKERLVTDLHEMSKPLARYEGDEDLDKLLREREREDDPMLASIKQNKVKEQIKEGNYKERPKYKGPTPALNRFNISPGYRWDGVNRSNGFENKYFEKIANKESTLEEAYRWSTQDM